MRIAQLLLRFSITILLVKMCLGKIGNYTQKRRNPIGNPNYPPEVHRMFRDKLEKQRGPTTMGVWSAWDDWSPCSRSCGGGVTNQIRHCVNKPIPPNRLRLFKHRKRRQNLKKITNHCIGLYKRIRLCNTQDCPENIDFRLEQCTAFNRRPFRGKVYNWLPYNNAVEECALNCLAVGGGFYATLNSSVVDGTPCMHPLTLITGRLAAPGTDGVCVEGKCKSVGLDGIIGGPSLLDDPALSPGGAVSGECSACLRGQCRSISGLYTRPDLPPGYSLVAQIPQGACRLIVQQLKHTTNILGLRNSNGSYILNGEWKFSHSMTVEGAGTHFIYRKQDTASLETITASGPLSNPVDIVIYYQQPNPGIKYGYSIPISAPPIAPLQSPGGPIYRHHESPIDEAPTSDIGILDTHRYDTDGNSIQHHGGSSSSSSREFHQHPNIVGVQKDQAGGATGGGTVHPHRRGGRIGRRRFMWKVTGAETCSRPCGGGTQSPIYTCIREITQTPVPERRCTHLEKPATPQLRCNMHSCADGGGDQSGAEQRVDPPPLPPINTPQGHWSGRWEPCNVSCGQGVQHYRVHCIQEIGVAGRTITLSDSDCPPPKPGENRRACALAPCETDRNRGLDDPSDNELPQHPEDRLKKTWPPYGDWQIGPWSSCSVSCGTGQRTRAVTCHVSSECRQETRPFHAEYCEMGPCSTATPSFSPGGQTPHNHWLVTEWSVCSEQCGTGTQHRRGYCARPPCGGSDTTPETSRQCSSERACAGQWFSGPWSVCSDPCTGLSIQTREVYCIGKVRNGHSHYQPRITQDMTCSMTERPPTERPCLGDGAIRLGSGGYCPVQWFQGDWSECENCEYSGSGIQRRDVRCIRPTDGGSNDLIGGQPASGCKVDEQPLMKRPCACARHHGNMQPVQTATPMPPYARTTHVYATAKPTTPSVKTIVQDQPGDNGCDDKIRNCYLAVQARLCQYPYYAAHCCTSCKRAPQDQD